MGKNYVFCVNESDNSFGCTSDVPVIILSLFYNRSRGRCLHYIVLDEVNFLSIISIFCKFLHFIPCSLLIDRYPLDVKTPFGYAVDYIITGGAFVLMCYLMICPFGILFGYFGIVMTIIYDIQRKLHNFMEDFKIKIEPQIIREFGDIIRITSECKELSI